MLDAGFEAVLGTVLVLGVVFGNIDHRDFPNPGPDLVLALLGLGLMGLGGGLAELLKREALSDPVLRVLAAGNAGFAILIAAWVLLADGFTSTGRAAAWATGAVLVLLAALQAGERGR